MFVPLYMQELRGLGRGRWVWFSLAALHGFFGLLMVGPGVVSYMLDLYLSLVYLLVPSGFATFMVLQIAGPRATRFVHSVFTAPVRESTYIFVKLAVGLTVAGLYYMSTLPFLGLYWLTVGLPALFYMYMLAGLFIVLFALAYGLLVGVVFTGRHVAAPVVVSLLPFLFLFGYSVVWDSVGGVEPTFWEALMVQVVHLSPQIAVMDAFGLHDWVAAESGMRSLVLLIVSTVGLFLVGVWVFLRRQSVEGWKDRPGSRVWVLLVVVVLVLLPAFAPAMGYAEEDSRSSIRFRMGDVVMIAVLVEPGGSYDQTGGYWLDVPVHVEIGTPMDLELAVLLLPSRLPAGFRDVGVDAQGSNGLGFSFADPERRYTTEDMSIVDNSFFEIRAPVVVESKEAQGLVFVEYWVNVTLDVRYDETADGEDGESGSSEEGSAQQEGSNRTLTAHHTFLVPGNYPNARLLAGATGVALPVFFLFTGIVRERRRR